MDGLSRSNINKNFVKSASKKHLQTCGVFETTFSSICTEVVHDSINNSPICTSVLDGELCASCDIAPVCTAIDDGNVVVRAGYLVDCGNVDHNYNIVFKQCGNSIGTTNTLSTSINNSFNHPSAAATDEFIIGYLFVWCSLFGCVLYALLRNIQKGDDDEHSNHEGRKGNRNRKNNTPRVQQAQILGYFDDEDYQDTGNNGVIAVANARLVGNDYTIDDKENDEEIGIGGGHESLSLFNSYSLYDPSKEDNNVSQIRSHTINADWQEVSNLLKLIRKNTDNDVMAIAFYHDIIIEEIEKNWKKAINTDDDNEDEEEHFMNSSSSSSRSCSPSEEFSQMLKVWVKAEPTNIDCRQLRGKAYITWAWNVRNATESMYLRDDVCLVFNIRMELADRELRCAREIDITDSLNIAPSIQCEMGRKDKSYNKVKELLELLRKSTDPHNAKAHESAMQFYCSSWNGSNQGMVEYARSVTKDLPDGHKLWILTAQAHFEIYVTLRENDQVAQRNANNHKERKRLQREAESATYWTHADVRDDILLAYHHYMMNLSDNTDGVAYSNNAVHIARNLFAYCLQQTGDKSLACSQCDRIGYYPSKYPWSHFGNPIIQYHNHCKALGL